MHVARSQESLAAELREPFLREVGRRLEGKRLYALHSSASQLEALLRQFGGPLETQRWAQLKQGLTLFPEGAVEAPAGFPRGTGGAAGPPEAPAGVPKGTGGAAGTAEARATQGGGEGGAREGAEGGRGKAPGGEAEREVGAGIGRGAVMGGAERGGKGRVPREGGAPSGAGAVSGGGAVQDGKRVGGEGSYIGGKGSCSADGGGLRDGGEKTPKLCILHQGKDGVGNGQLLSGEEVSEKPHSAARANLYPETRSLQRSKRNLTAFSGWESETGPLSRGSCDLPGRLGMDGPMGTTGLFGVEAQDLALTEQQRVVFSAGDALKCITFTANSRAVAALWAHGFPLPVHVHRPVWLTGL